MQKKNASSFFLFFLMANGAMALFLQKQALRSPSAHTRETKEKLTREYHQYIPAYSIDQYPLFNDSEDYIGWKDKTKQKKNKLKIYGGTSFGFNYGHSFFSSEKQRDNFLNPAGSTLTSYGFTPSTDIKIDMKGDISEEVSVDINYDQKEAITNNQITVEYHPSSENRIIRSFTAGNIRYSFNDSPLITKDIPSIELFGIQAELGKDKLRWKTVAGINQTLHETEVFHAGFREKSLTIPEYRFQRRKVYRLEPFAYYDNLSAPPAITAASYTRDDPNSLITLTSTPTTGTFTHGMPSIEPYSLEVYLDDRDNTNNSAKGAMPKYINGNLLGNFHRLSEGVDYNISYNDGRIVFINDPGELSRIYVRYNRKGSVSSTDPSARFVAGKHEVFIKYGRNLNEDSLKDGVVSFTGSDDIEVIPDGIVNLDIYEIRSTYDLGVFDIEENSFELHLVSRNQSIVPGLEVLGRYQIDFRNGILSFDLREPFSKLKDNGSFIYSDSQIKEIYSETQSITEEQNNRFSINGKLRARTHSFQVKHQNIAEGSERVYLNDRLLEKKNYYLDYYSGYLQLEDSILASLSYNDEVRIEYQYLPYGINRDSYLLGTRVEYEPYPSFTIGGSLHYTGEFGGASIPMAGEEPYSLLIATADLTADFDENKSTDVINTLFKKNYDNLPVRFYQRGEYGYSIYNQNSAGKAIVDNMDSSFHSLDLSVEAGGWVLSAPSVALGFTQCQRAPLYYKYYYNPQNFSYGIYSVDSPPFATPAYAQTPGPYNTGTGHLDDSQLAIDSRMIQKSLVLDFDFSKAADLLSPFAGIQSSIVGYGEANLTGIDTLEFYAKLEDNGNLSGGLLYYIDVGLPVEDTDGDTFLDSEDSGLDHLYADTNHNNNPDPGENWDEGEKNGVIDFNSSTGQTEDIGYSFNPSGCPSAASRPGSGPGIDGYPSTRGNGALNSEDLDGDGTLNQTDKIVFFSPTNPAITYEGGAQNKIIPGGWKRYRLTIDHSQLTEQEKERIRSARTIRLFIAPATNPGKGKLYIDKIRFSGTYWNNYSTLITGATVETPLNSPGVFHLNNIDTTNNKDEYYTESFLLREQKEYEKLYGNQTSSELYSKTEGSLKMEYHLGTTHSKITGSRTLPKPVDISRYKHLNLWVNHRSFGSLNGDLLIRVGNDPDNYYEFREQIKTTGWHKVELELTKPSFMKGEPALENIQYLAVGAGQHGSVASNLDGVSWVNELYLSDPSPQTGSAWVYSGEIGISKPLFKSSNGTEWFNHLLFQIETDHKQGDFKSIGDYRENYENSRNHLFTSTEIIPEWYLSYQYDHYNYNPISKNRFYHDQFGFDPVSRIYHRAENHLFYNKPRSPHIQLNFQYEKNDTTTQSGPGGDSGFISGKSTTREWAPGFILNHQPTKENMFFGFKYDIAGNLRFQKRSIDKNYFPGTLSSSLPTDDRDKTQYDEAEISFESRFGPVILKPSHSFSRNSLLEHRADNRLLPIVTESDYIIPFSGTLPEFFLFRKNLYSLELKSRESFPLHPSFRYTFEYSENGFSTDPVLTDRTLKSPTSRTIVVYSLPYLKPPKGKGKLMGLNLEFSREFIVQESNLSDNDTRMVYDDNNFNRSKKTVAPLSFNLIQYPFWYFTRKDRESKNNGVLSSGREFFYREQFLPAPEYKGDLYNNSSTLYESLNFSTTWQFTPIWAVQHNLSLNHAINRFSLFNLPVQNAQYNFFIQNQFNLLDLFSEKGVFRKMEELVITLTYNQKEFFRITEDYREIIYSPGFMVSIKWFHPGIKALRGLKFIFTLDRQIGKNYKFLDPVDNTIDKLLYEQIDNQGSERNNSSTGFLFTIEYSAELTRLKQAIADISRLDITSFPNYTISLNTALNRFEYESITLLKKPMKDQFYAIQDLRMNLHRNINGEVHLTTAYEIYRSSITGDILQKVFSFEAGLSVNILF